MMTSISGTLTFRPSGMSFVLSLSVSFFLVVCVCEGIRQGYWGVLLLSPIAAIVIWSMIEYLGCQVTTNHDGIMQSATTCWGTNFQFGWDEIASWHFYEWNDPEGEEAPFVQFDFVNPRKPIIITAMLVESPGLNAFVREVRDRIPDREELSKIESFRWKAIVTREGLNLTGSILNHVYFRWNDLRSWQVCQKQPEQNENFIQFHFVDDRPPVNVGDAFVTEPTWERLLQSIRTRVPEREVG